jgi:hypothetical protein
MVVCDGGCGVSGEGAASMSRKGTTTLREPEIAPLFDSAGIVAATTREEAAAAWRKEQDRWNLAANIASGQGWAALQAKLRKLPASPGKEQT